jgi:hypothetical protein
VPFLFMEVQMHLGIPLNDLGELILGQAIEKRDFIAPANKLRVSVLDHPMLHMETQNGAITAEINDHALRQLATYGEIPAKYVEKLESAPELLERNLNHWLTESAEPRMVRLLANKEESVMRAFLSSRYRPLDNIDLAQRCLPRLKAIGAEIKSCALTETRFYLQAVTERITREVKVGDRVQAGIVISNSEVGAGSLRIEPMIYRLVCSNGMVVGTSLRKFHVGRDGKSDDEFIHEIFTDQTKALMDGAFWAKVGDIIDAAFDEARFEQVVGRMSDATKTRVGDLPQDVVEVTASAFGLNKDEQDAMMRHLFEGGDLSLWGVVNAVTRTAADVSSYDRAVELERIGGQILGLKPSAFSKN